MALFPPSFIDDLKSHADIVQVVQERVPLKRSGASWKGLCPFHGEKTPSFHVNDKGFFQCFGCGVGGDVIKFVELLREGHVSRSGAAARRAVRPDRARTGGWEAGCRGPARSRGDAPGPRDRRRVVSRAAGGAAGRRRAAPARDARHLRRRPSRLLGHRLRPAVAGSAEDAAGAAKASRRTGSRGPVFSSNAKAASLIDRFRNRLMIPDRPRQRRDHRVRRPGDGRRPGSQVPEFTRDGDLCQRPDALRAAPEQGGHREGQARRDGRRVFRRRPGAAGGHYERRRLVGNGADAGAGPAAETFRRQSRPQF